MNRSKRVLAIVAHADDEALGCGGTLKKHSAEGDHVTVIFLTDGVGARQKSGSEKKERSDAARKAANQLGIGDLVQFDFPDNELDSVPLLSIVQTIEQAIKRVEPNIIYTHHNGDLNIDHQVCNKAAITATRPVPGNQIEALYGFEVLSSTEWAFGTSEAFCPQHFVDITEEFPRKVNSLSCYESEMREFPHSRSIEAVEALARLRGATIGVHYAEAFSVIRTINFKQ